MRSAELLERLGGIGQGGGAGARPVPHWVWAPGRCADGAGWADFCWVTAQAHLPMAGYGEAARLAQTAARQAFYNTFVSRQATETEAGRDETSLLKRCLHEQMQYFRSLGRVQRASDICWMCWSEHGGWFERVSKSECGCGEKELSHFGAEHGLPSMVEARYLWNSRVASGVHSVLYIREVMVGRGLKELTR
ncbi:hypothetical protein FQA39_LY18564 [Lamprigera yunnana]|nr:hypothetical protein FQA39_LY18564 [Lamprigera yunnana]